jgi:hypothetical protein
VSTALACVFAGGSRAQAVEYPLSWRVPVLLSFGDNRPPDRTGYVGAEDFFRLGANIDRRMIALDFNLCHPVKRDRAGPLGERLGIRRPMETHINQLTPDQAPNQVRRGEETLSRVLG